MLGGPPGAGKTTVLRVLRDAGPGCATVDADDVWSPATFAQRDQQGNIGIDNVADAVRCRFAAGHERVVLAWVFAREQMYQPFLDRFAELVDEVRLLYLVASPSVIEMRLNGRGDPEKVPYAWSRLDLIRCLPFRSIDTSFLTPASIAAEIKAEMRWCEAVPPPPEAAPACPGS
jgi:hypothetical protein